MTGCRLRWVFRARGALGLLLVSLPGWAAGCGDGAFGQGTGDAIPRELFVSTYVALRMAALDAPNREVPAVERDRILQEKGITEEDLIHFVDVHGGEAAYMHELWDSVDAEIRRLRIPPDSVEAGVREP